MPGILHAAGLALIVILSSFGTAHAEEGYVLAKVESVGLMLLRGETPKQAAQAYVQRLNEHREFPGSATKLRSWAAGQSGSPDAFALQRLGANGKPFIGVQLNHVRDVLGGSGASERTRQVVEGIERAGGIPVLLPVGYRPSQIKELVKAIDHLVLVGGDDIHPKHYGRPITHSTVDDLRFRRDAYEKLIAKAALAMDKRIVGICRGCQMINVVTKGALHQDIQKEGVSSKPHRGANLSYAKHSVRLTASSGSAKTFGKRRLGSVPSMHHQSVESTGPNVRVTGRAPDGVAEVIEGKGDRVRGYQFHPEASPALARKVFGDVVEHRTTKSSTRTRHLSLADWKASSAASKKARAAKAPAKLRARVRGPAPKRAARVRAR